MKKLITIFLITLSCGAFGQSDLKSKQPTTEFWTMTKKDSLNVRTIQKLIVFKGEYKKTLDEMVFVWYQTYKFEDNTESEIFMHTVQELSKEVSKLK